MARPNPRRSIGTEQALSRRLQWERERRGWSYDGLASRMTNVGCPIQPSALYKIEKGDPPRRITVDELVALAQVMEHSVPDLLQPVEMVLHEDITRTEQAEKEAWKRLQEAADAALEARSARAALYRKALSGQDERLGEAVNAFWAEKSRSLHPAGKSNRGGGGLAKIDEELRAERARETPEQRARRKRDIELEDATLELFKVIRKLADPDEVLGDS